MLGVGYYNIDMGLSISDSNFDGDRIMAIQDMNNDKYADLVTLNED